MILAKMIILCIVQLLCVVVSGRVLLRAGVSCCACVYVVVVWFACC